MKKFFSSKNKGTETSSQSTTPIESLNNGAYKESSSTGARRKTYSHKSQYEYCPKKNSSNLQIPTKPPPPRLPPPLKRQNNIPQQYPGSSLPILPQHHSICSSSNTSCPINTQNFPISSPPILPPRNEFYNKQSAEIQCSSEIQPPPRSDSLEWMEESNNTENFANTEDMTNNCRSSVRITTSGVDETNQELNLCNNVYIDMEKVDTDSSPYDDDESKFFEVENSFDNCNVSEPSDKIGLQNP